MDTIQFSHISVYIVRHGQTEENKQKIMQGQLDTILNSEGEKQSDLVAKALKDIPFDVCYSSDLQRATDTAKRILVYHSGVELQTQIAVRERHMGDLQGHVWEKDKGQIIKNGERKGIQEPESPQSVKERAIKWWNETIIGSNASYVLVVSHGAWIRLLVQGLLENRSIHAGLGVTAGRCLNTGVSIVRVPRERGRGELVQYGNVTHLREVEVDAAEENGDERGISQDFRAAALLEE